MFVFQCARRLTIIFRTTRERFAGSTHVGSLDDLSNPVGDGVTL
jgi:hypothetical protein